MMLKDAFVAFDTDQTDSSETRTHFNNKHSQACNIPKLVFVNWLVLQMDGELSFVGIINTRPFLIKQCMPKLGTDFPDFD